MRGQVKGILKIESRNTRVGGEHATREERASIRPHFVFRGNNSPPPYLLLSTSFSALAFRLRVSPIYGFIERVIENRVCYEFVVVGGRVRNYQASISLALACNFLSSPYLPFVEEGSPLPSQVYYFQIASEEKRGVGERWEAKEEEQSISILLLPSHSP